MYGLFLLLRSLVTTTIDIHEVILMPTDKPRFSLTVDAETLELIDNFRYENRYPTRSEAVIALVKMGLEKVANETKEN